MDDNDDVVLVFRPSEAQKAELRTLGATEDIKELKIKISELVNWFKDFKVETIELWIEMGTKSGKLTELLLSSEGKGGCKITLKPK